MPLTREFFAFLTLTFMVMVFHSTADRHPPPAELSHEWLDAFTVSLSWKMPEGLPQGSNVKFKLQNTDDSETPKCVSGKNLRESLLTEKMTSDRWTYNIWTVNKTCDPSSESDPWIYEFSPPKPRGELVTDFKCLIHSKVMNCSWIPKDPSQKLTVSYKACNERTLKQCEKPYNNERRNGCYLNEDGSYDVCVLVETETAMSTFKAVVGVPPPKLEIHKEGHQLKLNWSYSETADRGNCNYEVCYKEGNNPEKCLNTTGKERSMKVPYDENCFYEFRLRTISSKFSREFSSDSVFATYGVNRQPDRTLTVIAIVIPIILSICVILSCYCFRRYSAVICPSIPDPSAIFKEMMMNGNKEDKTTAGLYTPVPEPEPCKVTLVAEEL
ncbi:uncharacterized protein V6R79_011750 [Siganus canaliculatus]